MKKHTRMLYITGVDGCGKTTLSLKLAGLLRDQNYVYVYGQYIPRLMRPVKWLARILFMQNESEHNDYGRYIQKKKGASIQHRCLARLYAACWILDYSLQLGCKLLRPLLTRKYIIMDRYYYDTAINLAILQGWPPASAVNTIKSLVRIYPKPNLAVYLQVPEEVAFARKDDIQSLEYLRERQKYYQELARQNDWAIIDGTQKPKQVLTDALVLIQQMDANYSANTHEKRKQ